MNRSRAGIRRTVAVLVVGTVVAGGILRADTLELLWQLEPGSRAYIDPTGNTERGVAINPAVPMAGERVQFVRARVK